LDGIAFDMISCSSARRTPRDPANRHRIHQRTTAKLNAATKSAEGRIAMSVDLLSIEPARKAEEPDSSV